MGSKKHLGAKTGSRRVRLDHRRHGYRLDGELQRGFPDHSDLSREDRLLVARWAERFAPERLSAAQRELLEEPDARRAVSPAQRELQENQRELELPYLAALYESLTEEQRRTVDDPASSGDRGAGYPLRVGDLARLTGATDRQVRKWADDGLLPFFREGNQRRFYSAALIRSFAINRASGAEKAVLIAAVHGEAGHLLQLLAAALGRAALRFPAEEADQLASLAQALARSSRLMADVDQGDETARMWGESLCSR